MVRDRQDDRVRHAQHRRGDLPRRPRRRDDDPTGPAGEDLRRRPAAAANDRDDVRAELHRDDPEDQGMASRVAKTICLLEFVRDLPRTEANIAACLVGKIGNPAPLVEVQTALKKLENAQFVRNTEEGWKLQTAQEKNWDIERRRLAPRSRDRNEILRETLQAIFADPKLKTYRFRNLKSFRVGISVDGVQAGEEGQIQLSIATAEDDDTFPARLAEVRNDSRQEVHKNDLYWVFALTPEIDGLIANLYASRQMVVRYDQLRAHSAALFPALAAELRERTGIDNGYLRCGGLEFFDEANLGRLLHAA